MRSTRLLAIVGALGLLSLSTAQRANAQTVLGTVLGTVRDSQGAVIADAQVSIKNIGTGVVWSATTNDLGQYYVPNVAVGSYQVTASRTSFKTEMQTEVVVTVGASITVNFDLDIGDIEQTVVVSTSQQVDTATSSVGGLVSDQVIRELPLNGRDWLQLAVLQPGVVYVAAQTQDAQKVQKGNGLELSISGGRPVENLFRIDGLVVNDYANAGPGSSLGLNLGVDAIQEFSVLASAYSAQYGRSGGGVINAVFKSGTNSFHGSGFEFLRNSALDARNFFDGATVPPFRRNNFGGSIGGPIQEAETFFFANYEGLREFQSQSASSNTLTAAARAGNLVAGHVNVDPRIVPYLALFPLPNGPITGDTGKFFSSGGLIGHEDYLVGKVDHLFSERTVLAGSYSFDNTNTNFPDAFSEKLIGAKSRRQNVALSLDHSFNSHLSMSFRGGVSRTFADGGIDQASGASPALVDPRLGFFPGDNAGTLTITGLTTPGGVGSSIYLLFGYTSTQASEDLYWTRGRHNLKFGAYIERIESNSTRAVQPIGNWTFGSIANFLTVKPQLFAGPLPGNNFDRGMRETVLAGYVDDGFRVKPNLTLNLGLRYEMATVISEVNGREANLRNLTDPSVTIGGPLYKNPTLKNFEPRVGFAWDPRGTGKTAIRGGVGIFDVLPLPYVIQNGIDRTFPFQIAASLANPPGSAFPNQALQLVKSTIPLTTLIEFTPHRSYVMQYNLNLEHQVARSIVLMVGYTGSAGTHLPIKFDDINLVPLSHTTRTPDGQYQFPLTGAPIKTNPAFARIGAILWGGHSSYNALVVDLTKQFSHNLTFQAVYRWSRSIDNGDQTLAQNHNSNSVTNPYPLDMSLNRGPSDWDIPQSLILNYVWVVPTPASWNAAEKMVFSRWQFGGIFEYQSGSPFSVTIPNDQARTGTTNVGGQTPSGQRPNGVPGCSQTTADPGHYINLSCYSFPALGTIGTLGRNTLRVPNIVNYDFSLAKNFSFGEHLNAQLRAEAFNLFNHPSFQPATTAVFTSTGQVVPNSTQLNPPTVTSARQLQLGIRLTF